MNSLKLTIIIPAYNEINTIQALIDKVFELEIDKQIILVDDCSSDGTNDIIYKQKIKLIKLLYIKKIKAKVLQLEVLKNI